MVFEVDGGIEWELDENTNTFTIRPAEQPETGFEKGRMRDYRMSLVEPPWRSFVSSENWRLVLEEGITNIGNWAFYSLHFPTKNEVKIPSTVTKIGEYAFYNNGIQGSLTIPDNVITLGTGAFRSCTGLNGTLTLSNNLTSIPVSCFYGCKFTGQLKIPESVTEIGSNAFTTCTGFTGHLTIPDNVTKIDDMVFFGCSGLTGVTISNKLDSIGAQAFYKCDNLSGSLKLPNRVRAIGHQVFYNCSNVGPIIFEGKPTTLYADAFGLLNTSSPVRTYTVYSPDNWAKDVLEETDYTKFDFQPLDPPQPTTNILWIKKGETWNQGIVWEKVNGVWKKGNMRVKVNGEWK